MATGNARLLLTQKLEDYTWDELKTIADDLSENGEQSAYYGKMLSFITDPKTRKHHHPLYPGSYATVRLIGVLEDQKSDGTMAGLTFQFTHALPKATEMRGMLSTKQGGWKQSTMREWLNNTLLDKLHGGALGIPENIEIPTVKKHYNYTTIAGKHYYGTCTDKVFLLSEQEVFGDRKTTTGPKIEKAYTYFNTIRTYGKTKAFKKLGYDYYGKTPTHSTILPEKTPSWWLRSETEEDNSNRFQVVNTINIRSEAAPENSCNSIAPAFCL